MMSNIKAFVYFFLPWEFSETIPKKTYDVITVWGSSTEMASLLRGTFLCAQTPPSCLGESNCAVKNTVSRFKIMFLDAVDQTKANENRI
jgi:hypothetical protein